jgi:acyl-CoA synthetase (NDP forming)
MTNLEKLFFPRAVGIVGANNEDYGGGYFLKVLTTIKFNKPIYLFNPHLKGHKLRGYKVYGSILEIPEDQPIDYVILAVPAKLCPKILEEVGKKKVPFVTIFSSGFSEIDKPELEQELLIIARKFNIRFLGPNCLGIYVPKSRLAINRYQTAKSGSLGLVCQSGGLAIYLSNMGAHSYGTHSSKVISIGNQVDLNFVDFLKYFINDDETKIVGLYLENIKDKKIGREFVKSVKNLSINGKPVILWKVGFGESAKGAIMSHTGGLAGSDRIWQAIPKQTGACLVESSVELISLAMGFNYLKFSINRNVGIITLGGGVSIELTDIMERNNLNVPELAPSTKDKIRKFLPEVNTIIRNPLDLGGSGTELDVFYKSLITLDSDPNISIIIFYKTHDYNEEFTKMIIKAQKNMNKKLMCIASKIIDDKGDLSKKINFKRELFNVGIPTFESVDLAARTLNHLNSYREFLEKQKK